MEKEQNLYIVWTNMEILLKSMKSVKEASLEVNISACMISANLNGRKKSAGGYIWKYNF